MNPQTSTSGSPRLRKAMREKIYAILLKTVPHAASHANWDKMLSRVTDVIYDKLFPKSSEKLYTDLGDLEARVLYIFTEFRRKCDLQQKQKKQKKQKQQQQQQQQQLQQQRRHVCPPTCVGMISVSSSLPPPLDPTFTTPHYKNDFANFQSGNTLSTTGGFPGDSNLPGFNRTHPLYGHSHQQTAVANYHMVDVSRPQLTPGFCAPPSPTGLGISQELLLSSTHFPTLSIPFGSNNLYGVVTPSCSMALAPAPDSVPLHPNPMLRADATFTSNHSSLQGMQQTPYLLHHLGNTSFQSASTNNFPQLPLFDPRLHQQARDIQHQGQHSQPLYPVQLQNQDHLLYQCAFRTQMPTGLATPLNRGPSLDFYKEALEQQTRTGFKPSNLQFQQNAFNAAQSTSVHTSHLSSSPSLPPHPRDQKQSASVLVQRQSSQQNSTQISENNNGERQHIGVNSFQTTPMQPEPVHSCSSAGSPKISESNNGERELIGINLCQTIPMQPESLHRCSSARAPQISANNNGERELIGVNLCQTTSMQPEPVHRCSSESAPITISDQTVSPRSTAERSRLCSGNRSIGDRSRDYMNQIRWILLLLHARGCSATGDNCQTKFCLPAKKLLEHIKRCKIPDCAEPRCSKTWRLLLHYKDCRDKSCPVCVSVKNKIKKQKERDAEASLKCRPSESSESVEAYNKGGDEAISVDDDLQPSVKRLKIERTSQNATPGGVCKSYASMPKQESDGLQSDHCKSVKVEVMPMDTDVSEILVTRELEKHVAGDIPKGRDGGQSATDDKTICLSSQGKSKCMNERRKQPVDVVDASKMEISTLVELFTPAQAKEHILGLRQWVGQGKTKADKNKAMGCSISASACQLCALESLIFAPLPIYCSPCGVRIKRNALHYSAAAGESRHSVCATCYNEARGNSVSVDGTSIPKARLEKKKNDEQGEEAWVQCDKCQLWQHQICALFNKRRNHGESTKYTCPHCYIQEVEQGERRPLPQSTIPGAKSLPVTTLSNHIEQRLFKNLKKERQERARLQGKSYEEVPGAESLTVRVVASVDKVLAVKERFLELFREENYPSEFPYKSKVILLFQKIESVEVCLFGMFVQEFGTESGPPDQRRVYLSYLDSVKYFRPEVRTVSGEALRTFVYHEILIGYLDYCKKRGFTSCYIWACPPLKGEDYILYCHPEIQKTPKTDKLREWYLAMLRKASEEDVVVECTNLYDQFFVQSGECRANVTAARLPYFDGDYWPGAAEDLIQQMSQEGDGTCKLNRKGLTKKVISKRALRAIGQLDLSVNASKDRLMMQKLGEIICPMKEDFIMVHLQHCCKHCCTLMVSGNRWVCNHCKNFQICDNCYEVEQKRAEKERHPINQKEKHALFPVAIKDVPVEIEDKDDNIESEFFDTRQAFLSLCQGNNYQYETLRRAKHSSMMILYHLHNPSAPAFATICTICQQEVENAQGWLCQVCTGYDVCNACYPKASLNHSHNLISRSSATETSVQHNGHANQARLDKLRELLIHVTITCCRSAVCQYEGCCKMKRLIRHCVECQISPGDCPDCIKFWRLIRIHARSCRDSQCTVPKCRDYKATTSRQQQQSETRRRAAVMEMMRKRAAEATHTS